MSKSLFIALLYQERNLSWIKKRYLKLYKKYAQELEFLNNQIEGVRSIDVNHIKSTQGTTLTEKIYQIDIIRSRMEEIESSINAIDDIRARTVLGYRFLMGKSLAEIAKILSISVSNVRMISSKGFTKLIIPDNSFYKGGL